MANQAEHPQGLTGRVFGLVMARLNADMEKTAIDQLNLTGSESVLELGFGPGVGIQYLLQKLPPEKVAGVEPSEVMLAQALSRLSKADQKVVSLQAGSSSKIPWADQAFDAIISVNNIQFWKLPDDLAEVRRVLNNDGLVSVAIHGWSLCGRFHAATAKEALAQLSTLFEGAKFHVHMGYVGETRSKEAIYLVASKLGS